jgi:hypothetical protein
MDILCRLFTLTLYPLHLMHSSDHSPAVHQRFEINISHLWLFLVTHEYDIDSGSDLAGGSQTRWMFMSSGRCISVKNVFG